jgi:hypothetical protein
MGNACDDTKAVFTGVARTLLLLALSSSGIFKYTTTPASSTTPSNKGDKENREDITFPIGKKVSHHAFLTRKKDTQAHKISLVLLTSVVNRLVCVLRYYFYTNPHRSLPSQKALASFLAKRGNAGMVFPFKFPE